MPTEDLITDLAQMHEMGTRQLPKMGDEYAKAANPVKAVGATYAAAMSAAAVPWENLCELFQGALADTSQNLYDAGTVLGKAADDFATKDGVHAEYLKRCQARINNGLAGEPAPTHPTPPPHPRPTDPRIPEQ